MSNIFDVLYRGGVKLQNGKRYLTAETPVASEDSTVVPTTAWVRDVVETASAGAYPVVQKITATCVQWSSYTMKAPSGGGTWYCYGAGSYTMFVASSRPDETTNFSFNDTYASGANIKYIPNGNVKSGSGEGFAIKIA